MGRPRKPTAVQELNGAFRKNPARGRARENEPAGVGEIGDPPADFRRPESSMANELLAIWHELLAQVPDGVLTGSDRFHLEMTCRLQYKVRRGTASTGEYAQLNKCLGQMGLNPADRSKVAATKKHPGTAINAWEALAAHSRPAQLH